MNAVSQSMNFQYSLPPNLFLYPPETFLYEEKGNIRWTIYARHFDHVSLLVLQAQAEVV